MASWADKRDTLMRLVGPKFNLPEDASQWPVEVQATFKATVKDSSVRGAHQAATQKYRELAITDLIIILDSFAAQEQAQRDRDQTDRTLTLMDELFTPPKGMRGTTKMTVARRAWALGARPEGD